MHDLARDARHSSLPTGRVAQLFYAVTRVPRRSTAKVGHCSILTSSFFLLTFPCALSERRIKRQAKLATALADRTGKMILFRFISPLDESAVADDSTNPCPPKPLDSP